MEAKGRNETQGFAAVLLATGLRLQNQFLRSSSLLRTGKKTRVVVVNEKAYACESK